MKRAMRALSISLTAMMASGALLAQQVYKSVDETGKVIYSDRPAADAAVTEAVEIQPAPSQKQVEEAQQRAQQIGRQLQEMGQQRTRKQEARREPRQQQAHTPVEPIESSGTGYGYPGYPRRPLRPVRPEHPGGGDHPIYDPGRRPVRPIARPVPRPGP